MKLLYLIPHMFLVFSVFNPDAIKDLKLYKEESQLILEVGFFCFGAFTKRQVARIS
jgi:hypothetical protein